jgi:hypothetical protein
VTRYEKQQARLAAYAAKQQAVRGTRIYAGPEKIDRSSPHVIASQVRHIRTIAQVDWEQPVAVHTEGKPREFTTGICPQWMPVDSKRFPETYEEPKTRWNMAVNKK